MPINISTSTAIWWWRPAAFLRISGDDASNFLQGQFTNDLRGLEQQPAVYGLWLNVKGKVLADSFVGRDSSAREFWVVSYASPAATIRERLESFVIADDVAVEDATTGWAAVSVMGPAAEELLAQPPSEGVIFRGRRVRGPNAEWAFPSASEASVRQRLAGGIAISADDLMRMRIEAGIPSVPAEIGPGDLPNEGGLEADAISYTKGCYLGQEVMARLKSMGQVRRRLLRVQGPDEALPVMPAKLFARGRQVGELRSAVRNDRGGLMGFAMLSLPNITAESTLGFSAEGAGEWRLIDKP
jgi:folate-binding protein YgfZ